MPEESTGDLVPQKYARLLPKQEAPEAAVVGCIAWLFVSCFIAGLILLDLSNIFNSAKIFYQNTKVLYTTSAEGLRSAIDT